MAIMTITDVLMRWLLNSPIDGVADAGRLIVAVIIASFFPAALAEKHHISIAFLGSWLGQRAKSWLEVMASIVTSIFFTILGWQFVVYTIDLHQNSETTWLLGWPVAPWWGVASLFIVICVPVQLIVVLGNIKAAVNNTSEAINIPNNS
ncbi:MAG TPA: TRAP transporter small permease [Rhodospirillales bacterium]|jgi:TRAP-type C4-dicarboxylate transport system permease small subunit|nr:TRAP transporter small permease [Rhodospirillales bacterium]MDP7624339.1 TRAP transporter small permease [Rhodospirillales bacterium]HJO86927.1 TRAP transporter small permease [Rhodospirillales bacterium]|tara:strand:- start:46 stop:492 length:447 start_codon:yes stop_codon:yes gene_type:complete